MVPGRLLVLIGTAGTEPRNRDIKEARTVNNQTHDLPSKYKVPGGTSITYQSPKISPKALNPNKLK
jgi:hypothetical protein